MVAGRDGASDALGSADRPVLLEGRGALDGWRVGTGGLVNVVRAAVAGHLADLGGAGRWVVGSVGLDDVVFDERACGPAVEREVAVAIGAVSTRVLDGSGNGSVFCHCDLVTRHGHLPTATGVPSLATNKVASRLPFHAVLAAGAVGVGHV